MACTFQRALLRKALLHTPSLSDASERAPPDDAARAARQGHGGGALGALGIQVHGAGLGLEHPGVRVEVVERHPIHAKVLGMVLNELGRFSAAKRARSERDRVYKDVRARWNRMIPALRADSTVDTGVEALALGRRFRLLLRALLAPFGALSSLHAPRSGGLDIILTRSSCPPLAPLF